VSTGDGKTGVATRTGSSTLNGKAGIRVDTSSPGSRKRKHRKKNDGCRPHDARLFRGGLDSTGCADVVGDGLAGIRIAGVGPEGSSLLKRAFAASITCLEGVSKSGSPIFRWTDVAALRLQRARLGSEPRRAPIDQ